MNAARRWKWAQRMMVVITLLTLLFGIVFLATLFFDKRLMVYTLAAALFWLAAYSVTCWVTSVLREWVDEKDVP